MKKQPTTFRFNGFDLAPDENGNLNLTEFWRAAGSPHKKEPGIWKNQKGNKAFIAHISNTHNQGGLPLIISKAGRHGGGTVAHPQIALAYAKFLNHELHALVNKTFFERVAEEKNPDLILDRAVKTYERRGFTPEHIATRLNAKATRVLFTATLARHGVTSGEGFRLCTNAVYYPLFGGPAAVVRQKVGAGPKQNPRDFMSQIQLRTVELSEMLAVEAIEAVGAFGNEACVNETNRAARNVAAMVVRHRAGASL